MTSPTSPIKQTKNATNNNVDSSYRHIFSIAVPVVLANLAMPIQGLIDTAIMGHFARAYHLAGMGLAIQVFSLLLVSFNFLQYATSGLSAQAVGKHAGLEQGISQQTELLGILQRAISIAMVIGLSIMALQSWLIPLSLSIFNSSAESQQVASDYLTIKMWGIIAELMNYAFLGWFAGQGKSKLMLVQQSFIAVCNIILTLGFVYLADMGVKGVALGTVLAYWLGVALACVLASSHLSLRVAQCIRQFIRPDPMQFTKQKIRNLFALNKDIFIRTLLLTLCFAWITRLSAMNGDMILAVNAILLQVLSLSAYALDGLAVSAESLSGKSVGKGNWQAFAIIVKRTGIASFALAVLLSLLWWAGFPSYLKMMTNLPEIYALAYEYRWFAILLPVVGVGAYWIDGIFFGLTAGRALRNGSITATMIFVPLSWWLSEQYGMTGIWLSIMALLLLRFILLGVTLYFGYFRSDKK